MNELLMPLPTLCENIVRSVLTGTFTLILVGVLCRMVESRLSANLRCQLWRLSYVKLLLSLVGVAVLIRLPAPSPAARPATRTAVPGAAPAAPLSRRLPAPTTLVANNSGVGVATSIAPTDRPPTPLPLTSWQVIAGLTPMIGTVYLLGVGISLLRLSRSLWRTYRLVRVARPIAAEDYPILLAECTEIGRRLGLRRLPRLRVSTEAPGPLYAANAIVLPDDLLASRDIRLILAHELAHSRRRDLAWEWLGIVAQTLLFFHPLIHVARREEHVARESATDALAIEVTGEPVARYGQMLLGLALKPRGLGGAAAVGVIENGAGLRRRLLALRRAGYRSAPSAPRQWSMRCAATVLVAAAVAPLSIATGRATAGNAAAISEPVPTPIPLSAPIAPADPRAATRATTQASYLAPKGNGHITGVVRDADGKALPGARIVLSYYAPAQASTQLRYVYDTPTTDRSGAFEERGLGAGHYVVSAWFAGHRYPTRAVSEVILSASRPEAYVGLRMTPGFVVHGRVTDRNTGAPVAHIVVDSQSFKAFTDERADKYGERRGQVNMTLYAADQDGHDTDVTDADGRYTICLPPGGGFVTVGRALTGGTPRLKEWIDRKVMMSSAGSVAGVQDFTIDLPPALQFLGEDGTPVFNADVDLISDPSVPPFNTGAHTDGNGIVYMTDYGNGRFTASYGNAHAEGSFHTGQNRELTVTVGSTVTHYPRRVGIVRLTTAADAYLVGRVVDQYGTPIPKAVLSLYPFDPKERQGRDTRQFRLDSAGRFRLPIFARYQYSLGIQAAGFTEVDALNVSALRSASSRIENLGDIRLRTDPLVARKSLPIKAAHP